MVVVGNPANTNAYIVSHYAPSIPKSNFTALTRLDDNRARSLLAAKLAVPVDQINGTIIWGNHSNTQYPDLEHVKVKDMTAPEVIDQIGQEYYSRDYIRVTQVINNIYLYGHFYRQCKHVALLSLPLENFPVP